MKVNIKQFPAWRWYHNYLHDWFGYTKKRTESVRIDPWDTYSMDHTLALLVKPMLYQLAKTKHGSPHVDDKDVPEALRSSEGEGELMVHDRWDWVMSEMIFAFEAHTEEDWESRFTTGEIDYIRVPRADGMIEMQHGPNHTFEVDIEGRKAFHDRMQNGFRLFGTYFTNLWD